MLAPRSLIQLANHFKGTQVLSAAAAGDARGRRSPARSARHQGPGERQARARDRRGRRPQSADDRPARRRQIHAGGAAALDPAAADAARTARSLDDPFGRRRNRRRRADRPAAVPRAASFRLHAGAGRRRRAMRGRAKSRSPITACCSSTNCRSSSRRRSTRCASRSKTGEVAIARANHRVTLSGALSAGRGDEPVPLRPCASSRAFSLPPAARRALRRAIIRRDSPALCSTASTCMIEVPAVNAADLLLPPAAEGSARSRRARRARPANARPSAMPALGLPHVCSNAAAPARASRRWRGRIRAGMCCCAKLPSGCNLSARGFHRVLKLARTIADLDGATSVGRTHLAEAFSYRIGVPKELRAA